MNRRIEKKVQRHPTSKRQATNNEVARHVALKLKLSRERVRLHKWMEACHYNATNFMSKNFDIIVVQPALKVSRLVLKADRKIRSETARQMLSWSHYAYRQRLISAAVRYEGRHVIVSQEPGTSKTCTNCGHWHKNLSLCDRRFVCPQCKICVDKDVAAARNNYLAV
jgi:putative transposase